LFSLFSEKKERKKNVASIIKKKRKECTVSLGAQCRLHYKEEKKRMHSIIRGTFEEAILFQPKAPLASTHRHDLFRSTRRSSPHHHRQFQLWAKGMAELTRDRASKQG
jgi:hypothetical protein